MRILFLSFVFITISFIVNAQQVTTKVDERVELMCVVFRLAEASEYMNDDVEIYTNKIDSYFSLYKNHELIEYTLNLRNYYGIGYDAVMSLATHLEIKNREITLNPKFDIKKIDWRWHQDSLPKYMNLLNDFYQKSEFDKFFKSNSEFYQNVENTFKTQVTDNVHIDWFENFFGTKAPKSFNLVIGLLNGGGNYGAHPEYLNGEQDIYSIVGCWQVDSLNGMPEFSPYLTGLVAHEFSHSFTNPLIYKFYNELYPQAEIFFNLVKEVIEDQSYGSARTFLIETLVRACELKYKVKYSDNPAKTEQQELCRELSDGFLWVDTLYHSLSFYEKNRNKYPTLESFMPEIVKLQNGLNPNKIFQKIEDSKAEILGTNIRFNDLNVDYNLDSVVLYFDRPMSKNAYGYNAEGYNAVGNRCNNCEKPGRDSRGNRWSEDGTQWIMYLKLEPDTEYSLLFPNVFFYSPDICFNPKKTYYVYFKTRKKK